MGRRNDLDSIGGIFAVFFIFKWLFNMIDNMPPNVQKWFFIISTSLCIVLFIAWKIVEAYA